MDFRAEQAALERREAEVCARLDELMDGAAAISEFTVDFPLEARRPLTESQREVAVVLNALCEVLDERPS